MNKGFWGSCAEGRSLRFQLEAALFSDSSWCHEVTSHSLYKRAWYKRAFKHEGIVLCFVCIETLEVHILARCGFAYKARGNSSTTFRRARFRRQLSSSTAIREERLGPRFWDRQKLAKFGKTNSISVFEIFVVLEPASSLFDRWLQVTKLSKRTNFCGFTLFCTRTGIYICTGRDGCIDWG